MWSVKASLKIEAIGDNVDQMMRLWTNIVNEAVPGLGTMTFGWKPSYWVARITGFDPTYKYKREFLRGRKDYKYANSKGSRGVFVYYILESGNIYEVKKRSKNRFFCMVDDEGDIIHIDEDDVKQWINDHSESASSTQPESE
jgi:hypothetical protein